MKATILNGNKYLQKLVLQSNIKFVELKDRVRFTHMSEAQLNPYSRESYKNEREYQRRVNRNRTKEIQKYIYNTIIVSDQNKEEPVLFPTAMLLACTLDYSDTNLDDSYLRFPDDVEFYIVDGQHRLSSLIELYDKLKNNSSDESDVKVVNYLNEFRFNCTILLNFDMWEQARVFADVNFNQKKVDRSLYYSIYGMDYNEAAPLHINAMYVAHSLVAILNNRDESVLKNKIRMLGNSPGFVSQAFVADGLLRHIRSPRGIWHRLFKEACMRNDLDRRLSFMYDEVLLFFKVVKEVFPNQWPNDNVHRSIILKTTGIGALLRLMGYIHNKLNFDGIGVEKISTNLTSYSCEEYEKNLIAILKPLSKCGEHFFGFTSVFSGTGGAGLEAKLYNCMISEIDKS